MKPSIYHEGRTNAVCVTQLNTRVQIMSTFTLFLNTYKTDNYTHSLYVCICIMELMCVCVFVCVFSGPADAVSLSGKDWRVQHRGIRSVHQPAQRRPEEYLTRDSSQSQSGQGESDYLFKKTFYFTPSFMTSTQLFALVKCKVFVFVFEFSDTWKSHAGHHVRG